MRSLAPARAKRKSDDIDLLVFEALKASAKPLSAYQIIDPLAASGNKLSSTQAYRTLGHLIDQNKVQRIETLSAYVVKDPEMDGVFLCDLCHAIRHFTPVGRESRD